MTYDEAAEWMLRELKQNQCLDQETVAFELVKLDDGLTYYNDAGNLAIDKQVLKAFKKLLPDDVVWSRGERHWRYREDYDRPGRMQS